MLHFDVWGWNKKTRARKSKGPSPLLSIPCLLLSALKKKKKKNPPLDWLMTKSHSPRAHLLLLERHLMMNGKLLPSPHPTHSVLPSNEKKKILSAGRIKRKLQVSALGEKSGAGLLL